MFFSNTPLKVHFTSLGCPRNLVDTEVMLGMMIQAGYQVTDHLNEADYLIVNTCAFLSAARMESLQAIEQLVQEKKEGAKVVVTGCMVQNHSAEVKEKFPQIDHLLGSGDVEGLVTLLQNDVKECITSARSYLQSGEVPRTLSTPGHYAYLKIAEGCRKKCAFCIIPDIKGPLKSKSLQLVEKEFRSLLASGVKEVILIAQDLGDWGKDMGLKDGLTDLLATLLKNPGDYWLRLLYLYPDEVTDELIALMKSDKRLCRYVDMPLQHVNDDILKRMRRKTRKEEIIHVLTLLRREIPDIVIRTSLMVGFPGETEPQFQELLEFIQAYPLDNIGAFAFSAEPGASASTYPDQVQDTIKQRRLKKLMKTQAKLVEKRQKARIGQTLTCVLEGPHPETSLLMTARHEGQCPEIDGQVILNDWRHAGKKGERYQVLITDVAGYDLIGTVLPSKDSASIKKKHKESKGLTVLA